MESEDLPLPAVHQTVDLLLMLLTAKTADLAVEIAHERGELLPRPVPEAQLSAALQVLRQESNLIGRLMHRDGWSRDQLYWSIR